MKITHHHFETIDSTNTWAKQHADVFERDKLTLVTANEQTSGRGRFKRRWESPSGQNIYASFCFFLDTGRQDICNIPQLMALCVAETLEELGFHPKLKWPNDILLSEKKVSGILAETTLVSNSLCVIIGVGLNVNMSLEFIQKIDRPATSLFLEAGNQFDIQKLLLSLQGHFVKHLERFVKEGFVPFLEEYKRRMKINSQQNIRFNDNKTIWEGLFHSINSDGSLNLQLPQGEIKTFLVGEIM